MNEEMELMREIGNNRSMEDRKRKEREIDVKP